MIPKATNAEIIFMNDCELDVFPETLPRGYLKKIDFSDNILISIPDFLPEFSLLKELVLADNKIKKIPASLGYCSSLVDIQL